MDTNLQSGQVPYNYGKWDNHKQTENIDHYSSLDLDKCYVHESGHDPVMEKKLNGLFCNDKKVMDFDMCIEQYVA